MKRLSIESVSIDIGSYILLDLCYNSEIFFSKKFSATDSSSIICN